MRACVHVRISTHGFIVSSWLLQLSFIFQMSLPRIDYFASLFGMWILMTWHVFDDKIFLPLLYSFIVYFHGHMFHLFMLLQYFCVGLHHFSIMCLVLDPLVMVCYCVGWCWIFCYGSSSLTCHFLLCLNWSWIITNLWTLKPSSYVINGEMLRFI